MAAEGVCRFCGCTAENPCVLPSGDECGFATRLRTRCTAPACVRAFWKELDAEIEADRERRRKLRQLKQETKSSRRLRRWRRAA